MDFVKVNSKIKQLTAEAKTALVSEQRKLGMKHTSSEPLTNIKTRLSESSGLVNRVRFKFKKSGIFVHKGVGKGTPIDKVGQTNRKAKPWFNPVVEKYADLMMEEVADEWVDVAFNKILIK
jgi:hypothetical protein